MPSKIFLSKDMVEIILKPFLKLHYHLQFKSYFFRKLYRIFPSNTLVGRERKKEGVFFFLIRLLAVCVYTKAALYQPFIYNESFAKYMVQRKT